MTQPQPPAPLPRTPQRQQSVAPVRQPVGPAASASGVAPKIDINTLGSGVIRPSLNEPREKILLAGDTNSGKSYAWVAIAEAHYRSGSGAKFWVIDTDDTAPKYFADGRSFAHLYYENADEDGQMGNVYPFYCPDWPTFAKAANHIVRESSRGDWIIVDLASSAYAMAQEYIANLKGLNLDDEVVRRMTSWNGERKAGFGAFDGDTWGLVSRTYEASMRPLVNSAKGCHFIGLAHVTDMQTEAKRETREPILLFDQLGMKPTGVGKLTKMVDTAVVLWSVRPMDEKGTRSQPTIVRNMTVVKDRDEACHFTRPFSEFYEDLKKFRRTVTKTQNITDDAAADAATELARRALHEQQAAEQIAASAAAAAAVATTLL